MNVYWVIWTYAANYCDAPIRVEAKTAAEAVIRATGHFSRDFRLNGSVYVFDRPPCLTAGK